MTPKDEAYLENLQREAERQNNEFLATARERLKKATGEQKTDIVLRLIGLENQLRLSVQDPQVLSRYDGEAQRAALSELDLSRETLKVRLSNKDKHPRWWHPDFEGANLEHAQLQGADLHSANLEGVVLRHADLRRASLAMANLQNACLDDADLEFADLTGADLRGARLRRTNLYRVLLWRARLENTDLSPAKLIHVFIWNTQLAGTKLSPQQLGGALGDEVMARYDKAMQGYRILKQNFDSLGDYGAASWAYIKERQMEKKMHAPWCARRFHGVSELGDRVDPTTDLTTWMRPSSDPRVVWFYARHTWDYLLDWAVELLCGYGENVWRVLRSIILVLVVFGAAYWLLDGLRVAGELPTGLDYAIFSLGALTTSVPDGFQTQTQLIKLLVTIQGFLGIALTGLLGFVIGNRIRRS